jgi:type I restriction-modification system DNA methylase subunit
MMQKLFENYIQSISSKFAHKETTEMGYRTDFEILLKGVFESINVKRIDHDARAKQGNKPDFVALKHDVPILYIETKDIGVSLDKIEKSEQMTRYYGYTNLVLTDYVEFRFYRNGKRYEDPIKIANYDIKHRTIAPIPEHYGHLAKTLVDFSQSHKEPIRSGGHLSKIMAGKAQRIRDNVKQFLSYKSEKNAEIRDVYETLKKLLVHDLTQESFADMYAQTLVYGLFVARYHDKTHGNFSRQQARDLIPKSNPLLRHFFDHIVGPDFDKRLEYIVNELCEVFSHANVQELMVQYFQNDLWGRTHEGPDPVIHFYEDFLKEYDPHLRKKLGAFYTPLPVVRFIVRSVDYLLEKEFGLANGLADTSKTATGIHRVQILDPVVGTGTFISATIRIIYKRLIKGGQKGRWPAYVHHDLLPRLHGFELMMAPYTVAHLKLSMAFKETGFWNFHRRLGIYLTNSLEESTIREHLFTGFGFAESIAKESKEASAIKNKTPIMVVIGNPPYSGESSNASYSGNDVYKIEPSGGKLRERNSKWLNDDYVKFIRFAESMIEKTGEGIIAMITAHGYIDNPTFRGMRFHLMQTFDEIYVLDLHGNANKQEKAPDGSDDKNVFDIKQGVAIFIGVKHEGKFISKSGKVFRADCFGVRQKKLEYLNDNLFKTVPWKEIMPSAPNYEWIARDEKIRKEYLKGFSVADLFPISTVGFVTARDGMSIQHTKADIEQVVSDFQTMDIQTLRVKYDLRKDTRDWKIGLAKDDVIKHFSDEKLIPISYRPFDTRWTFYTGNSKGFHCMPRGETMRHFLTGENIGFVTVNRSPAKTPASYFFITTFPCSNGYIRSDSVSIDTVFPLYLYLEDGSHVPNLKIEIIDQIENNVGKVSPDFVFHYIYAVLHSPNYREKYKEFLKIGFPHVPFPQEKESFKKLIALGAELRSLHLLESPKVNQFITTYPIEGSDIVDKLDYKDGKVFINKDQYFGNVPVSAWNFYVGGYQPAQKWLKDRKNHTLSNADIEHYQKMIVALSETDRIMKEIDKIIID